MLVLCWGAGVAAAAGGVVWVGTGRYSPSDESVSSMPRPVQYMEELPPSSSSIALLRAVVEDELAWGA
jgi:hypothetical protein